MTVAVVVVVVVTVMEKEEVLMAIVIIMFQGDGSANNHFKHPDRHKTVSQSCFFRSPLLPRIDRVSQALPWRVRFFRALRREQLQQGT